MLFAGSFKVRKGDQESYGDHFGPIPQRNAANGYENGLAQLQVHLLQ